MDQQPLVQQQQMMAQPMPGQVVVVQQPGAGQRGHDSYPLIWPSEPCMVTCHYCQFKGQTRVDRTFNERGQCCCIFLCFCVLGCIGWCIACCIDSWNIYTHHCSNCNKPVGARNAGQPIYY